MELLEFIRFRLPSVIAAIALVLLNFPQIPVLSQPSEYRLLKIIGLLGGFAVGKLSHALAHRCQKPQADIWYFGVVIGAVLGAVLSLHQYSHFRLDSENYQLVTKGLYTVFNVMIGILLWYSADAVRRVADSLFGKDDKKNRDDKSPQDTGSKKDG